MSKRKFKFIDLADDDYIEEEIVNQKESNNEKILETKKNLEEDILPIKEHVKIETIDDTKVEDKGKIFNSETIKNIPEFKSEILESKKIINKSKESTSKNIKADIFFKEKEKLDVKTNIYLKKDNYLKIEELYKKTGNSRSSIINKLIEIALNKIDEN